MILPSFLNHISFYIYFAGNILIVLAALIIPCALLFNRIKFGKFKQAALLNWIAGAMLLCAIMHFFQLVDPQQLISLSAAFINLAVGACGVIAAWRLASFLPIFIKLPSPSELQRNNLRLMNEVSERRKAELNLNSIKESLETIVENRTSELTALTERLRAQEAMVLQLNENLNLKLIEMQALLEAAPIGIVVTRDPEYKIFEINRFCAELFDQPEGTKIYDRSTLFTSPTSVRFYKDGAPISEYDMPVTRALRENRDIIENEIKVVHPSGREIELIEYAILLRDANQKVQGVMVLFIDITDRKVERRTIEDELIKAKHAADRASESKTFFLANISHEMRTPLGIIMGFSDIALNETNSSEMRSQALQTIKRNAQQLSVLVSDVLDVSKVEAGRLEIEYMSFSLEDFLKEIKMMIAPQANAKKLEFVVRAEGEIPREIVSDANRLKQILINLIGNAIKFTERGKIELIVSSTSSGVMHSPVKLNISVKDTGIGITDDQLPRLFHPFSQGDASMSRRFGGTGLGLMLSKSLAHALEGELVLKWSEPGRGSEFMISIDAGCYHPNNMYVFGTEEMDFRKNSLEHRHPFIDSSLAGKHILLVDDAEDNLTLVSHYLYAAGANVECAIDGIDAIAKVTSKSFDLVLMDIQMPRMDGYHATKEIRSLGYQIPIIAITAHALKGDRERYMAGGFDEYLTKPLRQDQLLLIISKIIKNSYQQTMRIERKAFLESST